MQSLLLGVIGSLPSVRFFVMVIYKISNTINDRIYIGSAVDFKRRIYVHKHRLLNNKHNIILQNHVNKYGIDTLLFEIVEYVDCKENLLTREQFYLDTLNPYFNICKIAGNSLGVKHSQQTKEKIGLANKVKSLGKNILIKQS